MADINTEKQKVKEITDRLEEGLKELFESEKYKSYLTTMAKFHNYSFNNTLLIAMQKPEASLVAGFRAWQTNFNRHVKKGERGIRILAPAPYKVKEERDKLDPVTGEIMLDENGMPQKEEVEVKIPAFRAVSVFDVSQTDGEPIPELEAKELLSTVEGYEAFINAVTFIAPVPIRFEDIPGDSKGYFSPAENRIAVQEGMSESQTLKTMLHETAHSMLHNKELNADITVPAKDRNTKEVEAESIAYTVCQHFGIETSEYSFGYIAGWSSGKDMKELKSSLDTIRRTASELITGIEGQLRELQRDREMMQDKSINGLEKESLLLIQNSDLSEYSLVSVRGMDAAEVVAVLSDMNDDDRLSVPAYLESKGAWTAEIANEETKEFDEYHLDVRYNTDTNEITDLKKEMAWNERAEEPIGADDVILKIVHADGFEVERITNKTSEEVQEIMAALTKLENTDRKNIRDCLESNGADYIPIIVEGGRNSETPQFNDFEIDLGKKEVAMMSHLSTMQQAEGIINRLEYAKTAFSDDERSLIVNYAYKLNDMEKTRELAEHIYYEETEGSQGAALAVIDAQAEIDALPDPMIGLSEMEEYGYTWNEMLPLTKWKALELFDHDLPVYLLYEDGSETTAEDREQITEHEGIFGIEKGDWENERHYRAMQEELAEGRANREAQLLYGDTDKYGIYQLKDSPELRDFHFAGTAELLKRNLLSDDFKEIQPGNYNLVYMGELSETGGQERGAKLNAIYEKFNIDHPADYRGHSLSVSDIVVLHEDGKNSTHFVDSYGFTELPEFTKVLEGEKGQEADKTEPEEMKDTSGHGVQKPKAEQEEQKTYSAFYGHTLSYAVEHGEADDYLESRKLDRECKGAIEETIRQNFDGMHLKGDIVKPLAEQYGSERMAFVLANTLQELSEDGRFSRGNKAWASEIHIPENIVRGMDMNSELVVNSHPAVLDGFIDMFRKEVLEREKEMYAVQEKAQDTSGHDVQKPESEQTDMEDEDEIIDLGDDREQVLADIKQSLEDSQDTSGHDVNHSALQNDLKQPAEQEKLTEKELAFQIADRYISIQETEGGYDYSIMGMDYREIDGGVYDNPDVSIREALSDIVENLKENPFDNDTRGNISDNDELIPIDYDGLMEKAEEANRIEPPNDVVADFKAKTNELFHEISEMNPSEIEETVKCHVQAILDETGMDAVIVDAAVVGSRCRGLERESSDLDVVVEMSTNEREDVLFDTFNESGLHIGGVKVDINSITAQRTGSLESYLPQAETYLESIRQEREQEAAERTEGKSREPEVSFMVSECSEFHDLGEFFRNIPTAEEAVAVWKRIPPERMNGIPAIGISVQTQGAEPFESMETDLVSGKRIDIEIFDHIPDMKNNPKVMECAAQLIAKLPELEIDGVMTDEMEARVWEIRMPELDSAGRLAVEIDRFVYDYDKEHYHDGILNMTENVSDITESLKQGVTQDIAAWLSDVAAEETNQEEAERAAELLEKLTEYKPLAKIEEAEEQNYNMVDNLQGTGYSSFNNGVGEKAQREAQKREQEQPAARVSLKARLAEKKAQVAGAGRDAQQKENNKEADRREM